jgi:cytochrome b561
MRDQALTYGVLHRALHWTTAILIAGLLPVGWYMVGLDFTDWKLTVYTLHESVGVIVFTLTGVRLVWRLLNPVAPEAGLSPVERAASRAVHLAMYALMIAIPLTGWIGTSAYGFPVQWMFLFTIPSPVAKDDDFGRLVLDAHARMAMVFAGLVALHLAGVAYHAVFKKDRVLDRMLRGTS